MSLIEKAAKRLAELRQAGVAFPDVDIAHTADEDARRVKAERVPIPEAIVRRRETSELRSSKSVDIEARDATDITPKRGGPGDELQHPLRRIELDLMRLWQQGYLHPESPESALAQEFRAIKRPIIRNATDKSGVKVANGNLVMVTSALPGEGKTYVAINLAISIAMEVDHKVILVDGDVANPSLGTVLGIPSSPGLLDLLIRDDLHIADALIQTNIEGIAVLPSGQRDRRATELLASEKMGWLLRAITQRYPDRIVIFDSPPLLLTSEAPVLAARMGQVIMAVCADSTTEQVVKQALTLIEPCDVVMLLLNKAAETDLGSYGYYGSYGSYYGNYGNDRPS